MMRAHVLYGLLPWEQAAEGRTLVQRAGFEGTGAEVGSRDVVTFKSNTKTIACNIRNREQEMRSNSLKRKLLQTG